MVLKKRGRPKKETIAKVSVLPVGTEDKIESIKDRPRSSSYRTEWCSAKDPGTVTYLGGESPAEQQRLKRLGYRPLKPEEIADHSGYEDGDHVRFGDRVAMGCPRELKEERDAKREEENRSREQSLARTEAQRKGIYADPEHGQKRKGKFYHIP